jgi:hypothetical protein
LEDIQDILSKPKTLTQAYLSHWLKFSTAAFYMDQVCAYLNRALVNYRKHKNPDDPDIIKGELMTIEAVNFEI